MNVVIIGGGAAGATASQFARKQDPNAEITVLEEGGYPEYSRCGMPNVLAGDIQKFEDLVEFSADWFERNRIKLKLSTEATSVDVSARKVEFNSPDGRGTAQFDSLIFAIGASPAPLKIEGIVKEGVFQFRGMDDAKALTAWCAKKKRDVLIVGAGLVGLEVADALNKKGHRVTVVEYLDQILPAMIDPDMAEQIALSAKEAGITIITSSFVNSIAGGRSVEGAELVAKANSETSNLKCDTVVLAAGQKPSSELAGRCGCALGSKGHIRVDPRCETNVKGIYAVGDCAEYKDLVTGDPLPAGLGTLAVKMGEVAGRNSAGGTALLPRGFLGSRVTRLFGKEIAATGPLYSALVGKGMACVQTRMKGSTLPPYFPGGKELIVKLVCSTDGKLISCQIIGEREAAMRVDIVSAMISAGQGARELAQFDNAYAPSVAPCVDVLGAAAQGILIKIGRK
jgi:NADH oxidase (H2O2-forming)